MAVPLQADGCAQTGSSLPEMLPCCLLCPWETQHGFWGANFIRPTGRPDCRALFIPFLRISPWRSHLSCVGWMGVGTSVPQQHRDAAPMPSGLCLGLRLNSNPASRGSPASQVPTAGHGNIKFLPVSLHLFKAMFPKCKTAIAL